ncbi:MAG: hypothetical protein CL512_00245 [Actinobacteria bacterium]|nr:hypothetical protein [Actinomycetota bacterium]
MRFRLLIFLALFLGVVVALGLVLNDKSEETVEEVTSTSTTTTSTTTTSTTTTSTTTTTTTTSTTTTTTTKPPYEGWVDPDSIGEPWGDTVEGVLTFRGSPTRSWHGEGPVPQNPASVWEFPSEGPMCSMSSIGGQSRQWCGMGWTGQPAVFERGEDTWLIFGAFDGNVHFVNAQNGDRFLPDFETGDLIKGSVTIDPDGFPLVYVGSRDNYLRILSFDGQEARELWKLHAYDVSPTKWNNDWDSSPLVIDDYLFAGGENSRFHIIKLNRHYGPDGKVLVEPELIFDFPGWDDELVAKVGSNVSIETSPVIIGNTLYFANSGGLVQGWDISGLKEGEEPTRVFRFWAGDDIDATIVPDNEGFLYVGVEYERGNSRSKEVGQIIKLDPSNSENPIVWSISSRPYIDSGVWATPAVHKDILIVSTAQGQIHGIDRTEGTIRWTINLSSKIWSSPTIVDDVMVIGECQGSVRAFDVSDTSVLPVELWSVNTGGCVETTAAIWKGTVYIGSWSGYLHAIRDFVQ